MSGKYDKKKKSSSKKKAATKAPVKKKCTGRWILTGLLYALLIGALIFIAYLETREDAGQPVDPVPQETYAQEDTVPQEQTPEEPEATESQQSAGTEAPQSVDGLDLGSGVILTDYLPYTGAFMEDRTDEVVSDVLGIKITNTGEEYVQAMDITLTDGDVTAEFSLSTLFPGQTVVVLEKNRMAYTGAPEFTGFEIGSVALFAGDPGMAEDKIKIQCLDGVINITNISEEDITGDILVYYKNCIGGIYYGGITYRLRVEGGLKAGEIRQGSAAHFKTNNSTVVFATCG